MSSFEELRKGKVEEKYGRKGPRNLPQLSEGQLVVVQNPKTGRWISRGTIIKARSQRSYIVNINGRQFLRNRRFLRPCLNQDLPHLDNEVSEPTSILVNTETDVTEATPKGQPTEEVRKSKRDRMNNVRFADYIMSP